ncbi:non-ribosomal peptide synthetase [Gynuella sunshinyii]|uniref:Non-ribosomal peptide synthetase modules-related protein n=1 Tax=Gynuella sunshinyii YC6258 TaxID=1445510 RepID=A0A0C5W1J6_9GAMM|nr:non-ribosomal peptide synthetase [Gynuella sunshinyii]AJQ96549.1 non-ribosomal peptide synthetase modules-related protein [Gynuella sunshinyii YC6258]
MPTNNNTPASITEQQFWLLDQQGAGSAYNVISAFRFRRLDRQKLLSAIECIMLATPVLRSVYRMQDGELWRIETTQSAEVITESFSGADMDTRALAWLNTQSSKPFNLAEGPLVRLLFAEESDEYTLVSLCVHHIVIDLKSKDIIARLISALYESPDSNEVLDQPELFRYSEFTAQQRDWVASLDSQTAKDYWLSNTQAASRNVHIASPPVQPEDKAGYLPINLDASLQSALQQLAQQQRSTLYLILLSAYYYMLHKFSGVNNFCLAIPLSNRKAELFDQTLGCFVNTLPLSVDCQPEDSFVTLLGKIRKSFLLTHRHQQLPSVTILNLARSHNGPLYRQGFTFEHPMHLALPGVETEILNIHPDQPQLDLFLRGWLNENGRFEGQLEYHRKVLSDSVVRRFRDSLILLLQQIAQNPDLPLTSHTMTSAADLQQIAAFNQTARQYDEPHTLKALFERQVSRTPDQVALITENSQLSYQQFNHRCNQLAHLLLNNGVKAGTVVAVSIERSVEMTVAIYATIKTGAAYLPLDTTLPAARIELMLEQAGVSTVLTTTHCPAEPWLQQRTRVNVDSSEYEHQPVENPEATIHEDNTAYVIFTSGSTGTPKGVMNSHKGICNRLLWMQEQFRLNAQDVVLQKTVYSFDVSVWELFWPLQTGATLALAAADSHKDPYQLDRQIQHFNVSLMHFVPSMLSAYLAIKPHASEALRTVVCSGEELLVSHQQDFFNHFPDTALYNLYGPTEAAVDVTCWQCRPDHLSAPTPIGAPIANTQLYVVDDQDRQQPIGVMGELLIGGVQVAQGYIQQPELTARQFTANPFAYGMVYRTGDYARWNEQGQLEYLGRKDFQIKLNGVRMELAEIENALAAHEAVDLCAVSVGHDHQGHAFLYACYSTRNGHTELDKSELIQHLKTRLPQYMIPARFQWLKQFALTTSGKLDRKQLPAVQLQHEPVAVTQLQNLDETQALVMAAWSQVLGTGNIGLDESFFDAGGDSFQLLKVFDILKDRQQRPLESVDMFTYPTIRTLARFLASETQPTRSDTRSRAAAMQRAVKARPNLNRRRS